jgi:hypothetical protein
MIIEIISHSQFNEITKTKVLVYCYANWDPSCQVFKNINENIYNFIKK